MCRKLALTGWVLTIKESSEQARVIVAMLTSISFLALHFTVRPHKRLGNTAFVLTLRGVIVDDLPPCSGPRMAQLCSSSSWPWCSSSVASWSSSPATVGAVAGTHPTEPCASKPPLIALMCLIGDSFSGSVWHLWTRFRCQR
jgi:hypothetical protein